MLGVIGLWRQQWLRWDRGGKVLLVQFKISVSCSLKYLSTNISKNIEIFVSFPMMEISKWIFFSVNCHLRNRLSKNKEIGYEKCENMAPWQDAQMVTSLDHCLQERASRTLTAGTQRRNRTDLSRQSTLTKLTISETTPLTIADSLGH